MVLRTIYGFMIISFFANSNVASTLHQAVLSNDIVAVSNFIRSGVDINKRDGKTPLHYACLGGNLQIANVCGTPISPLEYWTMLGLNTQLHIAQRYSKK